jgi:hypothetical protein
MSMRRQQRSDRYCGWGIVIFRGTLIVCFAVMFCLLGFGPVVPSVTKPDRTDDSLSLEDAHRLARGIEGRIHFWLIGPPHKGSACSLLVTQIGPPESMVIFEMGDCYHPLAFACRTWKAALAMLLPPFLLLWVGFNRSGLQRPSLEDAND